MLRHKDTKNIDYLVTYTLKIWQKKPVGGIKKPPEN